MAKPETPAVNANPATVDGLIAQSRLVDTLKAKAERTAKDIVALTKRQAKEAALAADASKHYDGIKSAIDKATTPATPAKK